VKRVPSGSSLFKPSPDRIDREKVTDLPKVCLSGRAQGGKGVKVRGLWNELRELRKNLELLVGSVLAYDFIEQLLGGARLKRYLKLGERGWKWVGRTQLHTIDEGNGWCRVVRVIVKGRKGKSRQG